MGNRATLALGAAIVVVLGMALAAVWVSLPIEDAAGGTCGNARTAVTATTVAPQVDGLPTLAELMRNDRGRNAVAIDCRHEGVRAIAVATFLGISGVAFGGVLLFCRRWA